MYKLCFDSQIINLFYSAVIQSVLSFSIVCWFGNSTDNSTYKLSCIINQCGKLGVTNAISLNNIHELKVSHYFKTIYNDETHPLHDLYQLLPSGKRLRSAKTRTSRNASSFIPTSIKLANHKELFIR